MIEKALIRTYTRHGAKGEVTVQEHRDKRADRQADSPKMRSARAESMGEAQVASPKGQAIHSRRFSSQRSARKPSGPRIVLNRTRSSVNKYESNANVANSPTSSNIIPQSRSDLTHLLSLSPERQMHEQLRRKLVVSIPHLSKPELAPGIADVPHQPVTTEKELLDQAAKNHPEFEKKLWKCAPRWEEKHKAEFVQQMKEAGHDLVRGEVVANLKSAESLHSKVADRGKKVSRITDALRATIFARNADEIEYARDNLHKEFRVVEEDDQFHNPKSPLGYIGYHALVQMEDGHIAEVQIHIPQVFLAKSGEGHKLYEQLRVQNPQSPEEWNQHLSLARQSINIYAHSLRAVTTPSVVKSLNGADIELDASTYTFSRLEVRKAIAEAKRTEWWEGTHTGDERWITIHPNDNPEDFRHVKVRLRPDGKWRIVAGGAFLEHQEVVPRHELSDEEKAKYAERKKRREEAKKQRADVSAQISEIKRQHLREQARGIGISTELPQEVKEKIDMEADKRNLEGAERKDWVKQQTAVAQEKHEGLVAESVKKLVAQSKAVAFAADPASELDALRKTEEAEAARRKELAAKMLEARLAKAEQDIHAFDQPEMEQAVGGAKIVEWEPESAVNPKVDDQPFKLSIQAPIIADVETAQRIAALARESEKKLRIARKELPNIPEESIAGLGALEEFTISAEEDDASARERELIKAQEDALRADLNSSLVREADVTYREDAGRYERFGKNRYDVGRAQVTGALDAITGLSKHFLGSSFMDRPVVEALGIDGAAMLAAHEIVERLGRDRAREVLSEVREYHEELAGTIAKTALDRHKSLMDAKRTLEQATAEPLVDDKGNLIAANLSNTAEATALYGELSADAVRHVGTALGSLQASSSMMKLLDAALNSKQKLDTVRVALKDADDASLIDKALRLRGRYKIEENDAGAMMSIKPDSLRRYLKEAKRDTENEALARAIQDGSAKVDENWLPSGFKKEFVDNNDENKSKSFSFGDKRARAIQFAMAHSNPRGGGAVIDLEVGGGKTAMSLGYIGALKDKGYVGKGRRALYIAPKDGLASQVEGDIEKFTNYGKDRIGGGGRASGEEIAKRYLGEGDVSVVTSATVAADVKALQKMGIDPSKFFEEQGYDAVVLDEAHQYVGATGGSATGRNLRKLRAKYNLAMTGTLATTAVSQPFDLVRWSAGNKVDSRAKILRKYGEVGQGTEAWQEHVNADMRAQIDNYTFHGAGTIEGKLLRSEQRVPVSNEQRIALSNAADSFKKRIAEANQAAKLKGQSIDTGTKLALDGEYQREQYEILHDQDWKSNPRLQAVSNLIRTQLETDPHSKIILIADTGVSLAGLHSAHKMMSDLGLGDATVLFASQGPDGKAISQKQMTRSQARFQTDPNVRVALLAEPQSVGRNLQAASTVIHLDVPPSGASRKQREGRAYRKGRQGDVQAIQFWTDQVPFDTKRRLQLSRTGGMLEAVSG